MKKATLADVAALAEVSKATVSRYLKDEKVKAEIAERIAAAIKETGYVAKSVKQVVEEEVKQEKKKRVLKKTQAAAKNYRIALLCASLQPYAMREKLENIRKVLYAQGCLLQVYFTEDREDLEETYLTSCIVNNLDAVIVMSCSSVEFIQKQMRTTAIPVLYLCPTQEKLPNVSIDEMQAAMVLGKYLMQKQHLMIRYLGSDVMLANVHMEGIKEAYREMKQPHDFAVKISDGSYQNTFAKIKELFAEQLDLLILQEDALAIPLAKYVQEYHIAVPQNVSIVSFGGGELTRMMSPVFTSLVYDYQVYAQDIYQSVCALIEKKPLPARKTMFYVQEGDSVR